MAEVLRPADEAQVQAAIQSAVASGGKLAVEGAGSMAAVGAPTDCPRLSLGSISGIVDYDPAELVVTVRPGTPLRELVAMLADSGQMLAFEPFDHRPLLGGGPGEPTIGGVVAAAVAGSRRVSAGGARDHTLGLRAVSGRGEIFKAGGKVVKNVTGYDLPKLAAGSRGRLFAITELTLKAMPAPETSVSLALSGLSLAQAVRAMSAAMGSSAAVAAAAHVPGRSAADGLTVFRLEGFSASVQARRNALAPLLAGSGSAECLAAEEATRFWNGLRDGTSLDPARSLWRLDLPSSRSAAVCESLVAQGATLTLDWAGALVLASWDGDAAKLRARVAEAGGHATRLRAAPGAAPAPALHPLPPGLAALEARVRRAFDPARIFETGRFGDANAV